MKRFLVFVALVTTTYTSFSQSLGYNDLGILFSKDDTYGTARFDAMSGAFGALGSDISAITINPAGAAVARKSKFAITAGLRNTDYSIDYYGNTTSSQDDYFNVSQAGGVFVFDNTENSDWNRFAFSFNYKVKSDFENLFFGKGNSKKIFFTEHPNEIIDTNNPRPKTQFDFALGQEFSNTTKGKTSVWNLGLSGVYQKKLFVGASLNFHDIQFTQIASIKELNEDTSQNKLDIQNVHKHTFDSNGFSLGLGFIYKLDQNLRIGLAYETPTWYQEVFETHNEELDAIDINSLKIKGVNIKYEEESNGFRLKTPGKVTASGAYIFGKKGLISVDYIYKDYATVKFGDNGFEKINQNFSDNYRGVHAMNVGTEWRFDKMSLRGGLHYEQNPNLLPAIGGSINEDNIRGFSLGLGYNFGNTKIDLAYRRSENKQFNTIYDLGDVNLDNTTSRITGTLTFSL